MKCILFGLGPHAKRIYWHYLNDSSKFSKIVIVDLNSEMEKINNHVNGSVVACDALLFDNKIRNYKKLPKEMEQRLIDIINKEKIKHAIISTEPKSHSMYINFCLEHNINIMCDKAITTPLYTNTGRIRRYYKEVGKK